MFRKLIFIYILFLPIFISATIDLKVQDSISSKLHNNKELSENYIDSILTTKWDFYPVSSIKVLEKLESYILKKKMNCLLGKTYFKKGLCEYTLSNEKNSILYFTDAINVSKKCKDTITEINSMYEISKLYSSRRLKHISLNWIKKAYDLTLLYSDKKAFYKIKAQYAKSLSENNFVDSSIQLLNELIATTQKDKNKHYLGRSYLYLALAYSNLLDTQKVIENCNKAMPLLKNNNRFYSFTLRVLSENLLFSNPKKALEFAKMAKIYSPTTIIRNQLYKNLKDAYFANQIYDSAYLYFNLMQEAKDSLLNISNINAMATMNEKHITEINEKKIEKINMEKEIHRKTKDFWIIVSISMIAVILIVILFYVKIKNKNKLLLQELENKEVLIKEINHRVKNNLQLMSSLFSIQQNKTSDTKLYEALNTAKNRIHSLSLFYNVMNHEEKLQNIKINEILNATLNQIIDTYQSPNKTIQLFFESNEIIKDFDFYMQLGLVLNELIANSVKHNDQIEKIDIHFSSYLIENKLIITYFDNGNGFEKEYFENPTTTGLLLIKNIIFNQIKGKIELILDNNILKYRIEI